MSSALPFDPCSAWLLGCICSFAPSSLLAGKRMLGLYNGFHRVSLHRGQDFFPNIFTPACIDAGFSVLRFLG